MTANPPWLPGAGSTLLAKAILLEDGAALAAWEEWRSRVSLDDLAGDDFHLLPWLHDKLTRLGVDHPDAGRFRGIARRLFAQNAQSLAVLAGIGGVLERTGADGLVLRGASLAGLDPGGTRIRFEPLEIALPGPALEPVAESLRQAGWRPYPARAPGRRILDSVENHRLVLYADSELGKSRFGGWTRERACRVGGLPGCLVGPDPLAQCAVLAHLGVLRRGYRGHRWLIELDLCARHLRQANALEAIPAGSRVRSHLREAVAWLLRTAPSDHLESLKVSVETVGTGGSPRRGLFQGARK